MRTGARVITFLCLFSGVLIGDVAANKAAEITSNPDTENNIFLAGFVVGAALPAIGIFSWNYWQKRRRATPIADLVVSSKADSQCRKRVIKKVSLMLALLDQVRNYERHVWGVGDFTPAIRFRRYVKSSDKVVDLADRLEESLIDHIAEYRDEQATQEALQRALDFHKQVIGHLDKAR